MKKNYTLLFAGLLVSQLIQAQTLTKAQNEPIAGDIHITLDYDSSTVIPRNTGNNQQWNFSSLTSAGNPATTSTFVAASSVPSSSVYPGATLVEDQGGGDYTFYKSATTPNAQFEILGSASTSSPATYFNFSNSIIEYTWPMLPGSTFTDPSSGNVTGGVSGNYSNTSTVTATGNGTIVMPGGATYPNILQLKSTRKTVYSFTAPFPATFTLSETQYDYFEPSQKFPLLTVLIDLDYSGGGPPDTSITITVNKIITVGITDRNFDAEYAIYPNPAKDNFSLKLSNNANKACNIEIFDFKGQLVKSLNLGSDNVIEKNIPIYDLSNGIYMVKTSLGENSSVRKLIVE